ncbi:MAG: hypothetical protein LUG91_04125 [Ruminococcus sp.]|nr:hypothetical protein [Ruminococcus sp.]
MNRLHLELYPDISEPMHTRYGNIRRKLEDIIIIGLCTVICGGEDFADMEAFSKSRQEYLAKFALNLVSQVQYKRISKKRLLFRAALEPTFFLDIFFPASVTPQK